MSLRADLLRFRITLQVCLKNAKFINYFKAVQQYKKGEKFKLRMDGFRFHILGLFFVVLPAVFHTFTLGS